MCFSEPDQDGSTLAGRSAMGPPVMKLCVAMSPLHQAQLRRAAPDSEFGYLKTRRTSLLPIELPSVVGATQDFFCLQQLDGGHDVAFSSMQALSQLDGGHGPSCVFELV